jgi:hypothetical protein
MGHRKNRPPHQMVSIGRNLMLIVFSIAIVDIYVIWQFAKTGLAVRFEFVKDIEKIQPYYGKIDASERAYWNQLFPENDPVRLMTSLMNSVSKVANNPPGDAISLFQHAQSGGGLVCSGMAIIFQNILSAKDFMVRRVTLMRSLGDRYATHTIVEIFQDNHWIILDPTFNVTFIKNGYKIGAQDIHRALLDGSSSQVKPIFHGDVLYPARLDQYYMHYLSLYNNVLFTEPALVSWHKLPPFRYWIGKKYYVQIERKLGQRNEHQYFFNSLYFLFSFILPTIVIIILLLSIILMIVGYYRTKRGYIN